MDNATVLVQRLPATTHPRSLRRLGACCSTRSASTTPGQWLAWRPGRPGCSRHPGAPPRRHGTRPHAQGQWLVRRSSPPGCRHPGAPPRHHGRNPHNVETEEVAGIEKERQLEMWDRNPELELDYEDDGDVGEDAEPLEGHARSASPEPLATAPSALEQ
eukprot:1564904-Heterocapsa_arctica.AAC.1